MIPKIRIMSTSGKWANIKYTMSNAKSRMRSDQLKEDYEKGIISVVNPGILDEE